MISMKNDVFLVLALCAAAAPAWAGRAPEDPMRQFRAGREVLNVAGEIEGRPVGGELQLSAEKDAPPDVGEREYGVMGKLRVDVTQLRDGKQVWFLGMSKDTILSILAMPLAALLAAFIAYHPLRIRGIGVKKEEWEVPKALILIAVAGEIICGLVKIEPTMAFALFGFGSFIRFRTQVKNPKETVVIFLCGGIGCLCGLQQFTLAVAATGFVYAMIWFLDRDSAGNVERVTLILKGLGTESQVAMKAYKEKLEAAGVEVASSKVSLRKGNVTILINKDVRMTTEQLEEIVLSGEDVPRPRSVEWIRG